MQVSPQSPRLCVHRSRGSIDHRSRWGRTRCPPGRRRIRYVTRPLRRPSSLRDQEDLYRSSLWDEWGVSWVSFLSPSYNSSRSTGRGTSPRRSYRQRYGGRKHQSTGITTYLHGPVGHPSASLSLLSLLLFSGGV